MNTVKYYWDNLYLKIERIWYRYFSVEDPLTPYKIWCNDETYSNYSLVEILIKQQEDIDELKEKYKGLLCDVKRLEGENIELTNELYEIYNKIDLNEKEILNLDRFSLGQ